MKKLVVAGVLMGACAFAGSAPAHAGKPTIIKVGGTVTGYIPPELACGTFGVLHTVTIRSQVELSRPPGPGWDAIIVGTSEATIEAADSDGLSVGGPQVQFRTSGNVKVDFQDDGVLLEMAGRNLLGGTTQVGRVELKFFNDGTFSFESTPNLSIICDQLV